MSSVFLAIPSYADPDLPSTIESAVRNSSGRHSLNIAVCEQVTSYCAAYMLGRLMPDNVSLHLTEVNDTMIGVGGARHLAEQHYSGETYQVQTDSHIRFDLDWDDAVIRILRRLPGSAVVSSSAFPNPWQDRHNIPVVVLDRFEDGLPAGHVRMTPPSSGDIDEATPARTVLAGAMYGRAWCVQVPADPGIAFNGEESALSARLWTSGRELYHARSPWVQPIAGTYHPGQVKRPFQRNGWEDMQSVSMQRVNDLLTGNLNCELYGLGTTRSLAQWVEYSGIDFASSTVRSPWP